MDAFSRYRIAPLMDTASNTPKRWFQFSLRGLLLMTATIALGLSIGCLEKARLEDGLFAFATTWIVIGLVNQMRDLWSAFRRTSGLSPDQQSGWWFAILSRGALVVLLVGHFLLIELLATHRIALASIEDGLALWPVGHKSLRNAIFAMCLLFVFGAPEGITTRWPRWRKTGVNILAALAVVVLAAILLLECFLIYWLVHVACCGMALGRAQRLDPDAVWIYSDVRAWSFLGHALLATSFVLLDLFWLRQLARCWKGGIRLRVVATGALGISLALTAIFPVWLATSGFKAVSPCFVEVFDIAPLNRWIFGMVLVVLFVTGAARRMIHAATMPACDTRWTWRRRPWAYYHEHRLVALFVAATILCLAVRLPMDQLRVMRSMSSWPFPTMQFLRGVLEFYLEDSRCQLWSGV